MATAAAVQDRPIAVPAGGQRGQLAMCLQEAFTVAVRLRTGRQSAARADAFRHHIKGLLATADRDARRIGYSGDSVRSAIYAFIAFLDESVLNSAQPMFAGWAKQPLQEEVFGDNVAGETFYRNLAQLLGQQDSEELADVLEVYLVCLLLGFRGKYAVNPGALESSIGLLRERLTRIRGDVAPFAPDWALPEGEAPPEARDPWLPQLLRAAAAAAVLAVLLFIAFRLVLGNSLAGVRALIAGGGA
jgi:type VI secretion system protein ImpK